MNSHPNNTNPYAPPVPVEEDAASYDLLKIARRYSRLCVVLKWIIQVLVIEILAIACIYLLILLTPNTGIISDVVRIIAGLGMWIVLFAHLALIFLWLYSIFVIVRIAFAIKCRAPAMLLIILGTIYFPVTILVMFLMRRKAAQILRDAGIEITGGKVDLAKIPQENDY